MLIFLDKTSSTLDCCFVAFRKARNFFNLIIIKSQPTKKLRNLVLKRLT